MALGLALLGAPGSAAAQDEVAGGKQLQEAYDHFSEGESLFRHRKYAEALAEYQQALELSASPSLRYNIGLCQYRLDSPLEARRQFVQYLADMPPALLTEERRQEVQRYLGMIDGSLGLLEVQIPVEGAAVSVDGTVVGTAPLSAPVAVLPGDHEVSAEAEGYAPLSMPVSVQAGGRLSLQLVLIPQAPPEPEGGTEVEVPVEPPPPPPPPADEGISAAWFWVTTGIAGAAAVGAAVTGALLSQKRSDYDVAVDWCGRGWNPACSEGRSIASTGDDLDLTTTVLLSVAGGFAATAFILAFFTDFDGAEAEEPPVGVAATPLTDGESGAIQGLMVGAAARF
jgi:hypothetical protein